MARARGVDFDLGDEVWKLARRLNRLQNFVKKIAAEVFPDQDFFRPNKLSVLVAAPATSKEGPDTEDGNDRPMPLPRKRKIFPAPNDFSRSTKLSPLVAAPETSKEVPVPGTWMENPRKDFLIKRNNHCEGEKKIKKKSISTSKIENKKYPILKLSKIKVIKKGKAIIVTERGTVDSDDRAKTIWTKSDSTGRYRITGTNGNSKSSINRSESLKLQSSSAFKNPLSNSATTSFAKPSSSVQDEANSDLCEENYSMSQLDNKRSEGELELSHGPETNNKVRPYENLNLMENTGHGRSSGNSSQDSDVQILSELDESSKETDSSSPVISTQKRLLSISKRNERSSIIATIPPTSSSEDDARNQRQASRNSSLTSPSVELQPSDSLVMDISQEENKSYKYLSSFSAKQTRSHSEMLSAISEENSLAQNLNLQNEKSLSKPNKTKMADDKTTGRSSDVPSSSKDRRGPPSIPAVSIPSVSESTYSYSNNHDKNSKSATPKPADFAESAHAPSKQNSLNTPTTSPRKNPVRNKDSRSSKSLDVQAHIPNSNRNTRTSQRKNPILDKEPRSSKSLDVEAHIPTSTRNTRTSSRKHLFREEKPRSSKSLDVQAHNPISTISTRTSSMKNPVPDKEPRSSKSLDVQAQVPTSTRNTRASSRKNPVRDQESYPSIMFFNGQSHRDPTNFTTVSIPSVDESTYSYSNVQDKNSKSAISKPTEAALKRKSAPNKRKSHDFPASFRPRQTQTLRLQIFHAFLKNCFVQLLFRFYFSK